MPDEPFDSWLEASAAANAALRAEAQKALETDVERQQDKAVQFVDVTAQPPVAAAKRVLSVKELHPEWEVEPVDLSGTLEGVKPLREVTVDQVTYIVQCANPQLEEDLPDRLRFVVPAFTPGDDPTMHAYVRLEALPTEVQAVVCIFADESIPP